MNLKRHTLTKRIRGPKSFFKNFFYYITSTEQWTVSSTFTFIPLFSWKRKSFNSGYKAITGSLEEDEQPARWHPLIGERNVFHLDIKKSSWALQYKSRLGICTAPMEGEQMNRAERWKKSAIKVWKQNCSIDPIPLPFLASFSPPHTLSLLWDFDTVKGHWTPVDSVYTGY